MKNIKTLFFILTLSIFTISCSSDDDSSSSSSSCFEEDFELEAITVEDLTVNDDSKVKLTYEITNTSSSDYSISNGSNIIDVKIVVTTADSEEFETNTNITLTALSAGAKASTDFLADFGTDNTYASHTITLSCQ